jgi:hypothetical protein
MGYTGLEALLNYVYYQAGALNQYDQYGHLLHFSLFDVGASPCGSYNAGDNPSDNVPPPGGHSIGVPKAGGGTTTSFSQADPCVSWLGPNQPGINQNIGAPRYDKSVCPDGSKDLSLCDPNISAKAKTSAAAPSGQSPTAAGAPAGTAPTPGTTTTPQLPQGLPPSSLPGNPNDLPRRLQDLLGGGHGGGALGGALGGGGGGGGGGGNVNQAANDLLNLLFAP